MTDQITTHTAQDDPRNRDIQIWINRTLTPRAQATVSVYDSGWHRQVVGDLRNDSPDAGSQAAFSTRVMSSQIQWASALD